MHIWQVAEMHQQHFRKKKIPKGVREAKLAEFFTRERLATVGASGAAINRIQTGIQWCDFVYIRELLEIHLAFGKIPGVGEGSLSYMVKALDAAIT